MIKTLILVLLGVLASVFASEALAQQPARFLDISVSGSYSRSFGQYTESRRKSLGIELGLPLSSFFEVSLGHNLIQDSTIYNDDYREAVKERIVLPEGPITQSRNIQDYSANGALGIDLGHVRPSIFGGALRRKICEEDFLQDYGCQTQDLTWNAGVALQVYVTDALRLKLSFRVSPSVDTKRSTKTFDQLTSVGLTWGL